MTTQALLAALPEDTVSLLKSSQVVTSVWSAVKELVENSLDAGSTNIEVRLEDYGLARLTVKDNGEGVSRQEIGRMVLPHTTSKFREMSDFNKLSTYGFRGEALSSLCQLSQLTITSRTQADLAACRLRFDSLYQVVKEDMCAAKVGTDVTAENIFYQLPVRKNFYKNLNRKKEELEKVKRLIFSFSIVNPGVKFILYHDKSNLWSSLGNGIMLDNVAMVIGRKETNKLESFECWLDVDTGDIVETETELKISGLVPKIYPGVSAELGRCGKDFSWVFVNRRPVDCRDVERLLRERFSEVCGLQPPKNPVFTVSIEVMGQLREQLDPNLEPNKQKVGLGCTASVLSGLDTVLKQLWAAKDADKENTPAREVDNNAVEVEREGSVESEACFNHIGQTQSYQGAKSSLTEESFVSNKYGLDRLHDSKEETPELTPPSPHSPVLTQEMFHSPELPGVDAVYLNRIKAGEFTESEESEEEEEEVLERKKPRHPFINYECEETEEDTEERESDESSLNTPSRLFISPVSDRTEKSIQMVKLNPPKFSKLNRSLPVKRNIALDDSIQKIDEFIIKNKKARLDNSRDDTEDRKEVIRDDLDDIIDVIKDNTVDTIEVIKDNTKDKEEVLSGRSKREVSVPFNISSCESEAISPPSAVVGRLQSGWVVKEEDKVWLMFPARLRETILYERLMSHHVMPCQRLPEPLVVHPGLLSQEEVQTALKMFTNTRQCPAKITDRRVTHNGFMLGLYQVAGHNGDDTREFTIKLEGKCPLLPQCGLSDLTELLGLVRNCKDDVRSTRPSKVREYLAQEATRLAGTMTAGEMDRRAVEEMMVSRREVLGTSVMSCLHGRNLMELICRTSGES